MSGAGVVCGFWDEAAKLAGLGWTLGGSSAGVLARGDEVAPATAEIAADGDTTLVLEATDARVEAKLSPRPAAASLNGDGTESASCAATVRIEADGGAIECAGHLTRWGADPTSGAGVLRHLTLPAADGGLLVVLARGEAGASGHDAESSSAWLLDSGGGTSRYPDAFLSTQYDGDGRQTRAGLELWSGENDAPPMRAAGTLLGNAPDPAGGVTAALLRTSAEGTPGLGSYVIWRG